MDRYRHKSRYAGQFAGHLEILELRQMLTSCVSPNDADVEHVKYVDIYAMDTIVRSQSGSLSLQEMPNGWEQAASWEVTDSSISSNNSRGVGVVEFNIASSLPADTQQRLVQGEVTATLGFYVNQGGGSFGGSFTVHQYSSSELAEITFADYSRSAHSVTAMNGSDAAVSCQYSGRFDTAIDATDVVKSAINADHKSIGFRFETNDDRGVAFGGTWGLRFIPALIVRGNPQPEVDISGNIEWDPVQKGVTVDYKIEGGDLTGPASYNVYWANAGGTNIGSIVTNVEITNTTNGGVGELFISASTIGTPPATATQVVYEITANDDVPGNNVDSVAWDPKITVGASIDGNPDENVMGRYFKGVQINGLTLQVELSESLGALVQELSAVNPASPNQELTLVPTPNLVTFNVPESQFQPEMNLGNPATFTASATIAGTTYSDSATIDTIKLPKWLRQADASFANGKYTFKDDYVDVDFTTKFTLLENSQQNDFWFGKNLDNSAKIKASVTTTASLNQTATPTLVANAETKVVYLGDTLFTENVTLNSSSGANGITVAPNPRTLEIDKLVMKYGLSGSFTTANGTFVAEEAIFDLNNVIQLAPKISVATGSFIDYSFNVQAAINDDGDIIDDETKIDFEFSSKLSGELDIVPFKTPNNLNPNKVDDYFDALGLIWDIVTGDIEDIIQRTLNLQIFPELTFDNTFVADVALKGSASLAGSPTFSGKIDVTESKTSLKVDWGDILPLIFGSEEDELLSVPNGLGGCYAFGEFDCPE